jgi:hypothetical protein
LAARREAGLATAVRQLSRGRRHGSGAGIAGLCTVLLALASAAPCRADDEVNYRLPSLQDTTDLDGQTYSYYYVPRLSELNQLVGYLFRTGLVRKDAPEPAAAITRYAAYSCEGTLYVGGDRESGASEDINWSQVSALRTGPAGGSPSLIIERGPPTVSAGKLLVLYVPDATIRYQLHQALAVLVSECRPRSARDTAPPRERPGN